MTSFNGPHAGINFNDGFGGGNLLKNNLLSILFEKLPIMASSTHGTCTDSLTSPKQAHRQGRGGAGGALAPPFQTEIYKQQ